MTLSEGHLFDSRRKGGPPQEGYAGSCMQCYFTRWIEEILGVSNYLIHAPILRDN